MKFRPCIDIHNGKVKQIVGSSLKDENDKAVENYVSEKDSSYYAQMYKRDGLAGGHIIRLNSAGSEYFEATKRAAVMALATYYKGMQIGGGINADNAKFFLENGASHVIVTSYVFRNGKIDYENLSNISNTVGKDNLVLDLSCRKKDNRYYIVTDRWRNFTEVYITDKVLDELAGYCDEFLIHAVDVEGKASGIEKGLAETIGGWKGIPVTYAGGISSLEDIRELEKYGNGKLDFTIGSALDIFGGKMAYNDIVSRYGNRI